MLIITVVEIFNNILLSKNSKLHKACRVWPYLGVIVRVDHILLDTCLGVDVLLSPRTKLVDNLELDSGI